MGYCEEEDGGMEFSLVVSYNHQHFKKHLKYISLCVMNEYNIHFSLFDDILIIWPAPVYLITLPEIKFDPAFCFYFETAIFKQLEQFPDVQ